MSLEIGVPGFAHGALEQLRVIRKIDPPIVTRARATS